MPEKTETALHTAFIAIGSNMGDKVGNCKAACGAIARSGASRLTAQSRLYKTEPVGFEDQDWFVNAVIKIETRRDPQSLLAELKGIEQAAGRQADVVRFGPRILDLDILLYGEQTVRSAGLEIPHPRMHERGFVLKPICDIDAGLMHPVLKISMADLLSALDDHKEVIALT